MRYYSLFAIMILLLMVVSPTESSPARVYVQVCSDSSTGSILTLQHYHDFPNPDTTYSSPTGEMAQIMADSYRYGHADSLGHPLKITWYAQTGSLYAGGTNCGPLLPLDLLIDYHGQNIERWGDELAYHYHTWIWNNPDGDSTWRWNQAPDFTYCEYDFEQTMAHMLLDRSFFASSFRSGWHYMDNYWQRYLDDWFPYRFENDHPNVNVDTTEPIDNNYDWSRSPAAWVPYHPDPNDYQVPGSLRGWDSRSIYLPLLTQSVVNGAFAQAQAGTTQIMTLFSHVKEDFSTQITAAHNMLAAAHAANPQVEFEYLTGRECMLRWRGGTDVTPPDLQLTTSDNGDIRTVVISTDEEIYQRQPLVAALSSTGVYSLLDCTPLGPNQWGVQISLSQTARLAVGVTDWFGNPAVESICSPVPPVLSNIQVSVSNTTASVSWNTNRPTDGRVRYELVPSGETGTVTVSQQTMSHSVSLSGLLPGRIYKITASSQDDCGTRADAEPLYILTKAGQPAVIDNIDPGFSVSGAWTTGSTAAGRYGTNYRFADTSASGTSIATWTWQVAQTGPCTISAWWSQGTNRSTQARYTVTRPGGQTTYTVNQQANGGKWNVLGTFSLVAGNTVTVQLSNAAPSGYVVIADAVAFQASYIPVPSLGLARKLVDGSSVKLSNLAVTAVFGQTFYVETLDRSAGLKVQGTGVSGGDIVELCGDMSTSAGERVLANAFITKPGGTALLKPLALNGAGIDSSGNVHLSTAGMLVNVWGKVTSVGTDYFYIDDGSRRADGSGNIGLRVDATRLTTLPDTTKYVVVKGILGSKVLATGAVPVILPRDAADCQTYPSP